MRSNRKQTEGINMKVLCPICNQVGILEQRGNSQRIIHYQYPGDKRTLTKHTLRMGTNRNSMGTENAEKRMNWSWGWELNPYITALQAVA